MVSLIGDHAIIPGYKAHTNHKEEGEVEKKKLSRRDRVFNPSSVYNLHEKEVLQSIADLCTRPVGRERRRDQRYYL